MSNDPEAIRREIERTRIDLSENVNALGEKVNPGSIAKRQVSRVRGAATSVKDSVMGSAADGAGAAAADVRDTVTGAPGTVARKAQGSPIAAGLIAFGAGLLVASLLPASQVEQQAAEKVKDTAQPIVDDLADSAKEAAENLKEPAHQEVKAAATDAAATVQDEATAAAADVKTQAQDAKDTVRQAAS